MKTITAREASIFACFTDTVAAPEPLLPPVRDTDAALFFDEWLTRAPRVNALGLRAGVALLDLGPLALGFGKRLRRLRPDERARYVHAIERSSSPQIRQLVKALKGIAFLCYYGDDAVMGRLGYDADANLRRARALRVGQGRP